MNKTEDTVNWRNLAAACAAVCVFSFSLGEMFPLLSLSMDSWGVSAKIIGLNTAMAPVGILLAGLFIPKLSHSFGPKPVAIIMAFLTAAIFLAYPAFPTLLAWFPLRLLQGITVATLFALSEAWVLGNAVGKWRGLITGIYGTCISVTFGLGAKVVGWAGIEGYLPFTIGAAVLIVAALPICMVSKDIGAEEHEHVSMLRFAPKAPLLLLAICIHAMFDGGMLAFLAVYGVKEGMSIPDASDTIFYLAAGNVLLQIPIGLIADRTSKTGTMVTCFVVASAGLALLPFAITTVWVWPLVLVMGAAGFGIYTIGLAELGDRFSGADLIAGTSAFSTMWGLGALIGSAICGLAMDVFGPHGFPGILFVIFVSYLVLRGLSGLLRRRARA